MGACMQDNNNIDYLDNYVQNGTNCHLLTTQLNFVNIAEGRSTY